MRRLNVRVLHADNPGLMTGDGNWTYLIPGAAPVLVDAGDGRAAHLDALAAEAPAGPAIVAVTHAHRDHVAGAPAIAERWPDARFHKWPWPEKDAAYQVGWRPLAGGERLPTAEGDLHVIHTPGHAPDHVSLWHEASRTAFTGDLLTLGSTVVILASQGGRLADYLTSLERVRALRPARLLPAHGPPVDAPDVLIQRYLDHRRQREEQVIAALHDGCGTVDALVGRIYPHVPPVSVPMAGESVRAHLQKLADEGRATRADDRWTMLP